MLKLERKIFNEEEMEKMFAEFFDLVGDVPFIFEARGIDFMTKEQFQLLEQNFQVSCIEELLSQQFNASVTTISNDWMVINFGGKEHFAEFKEINEKVAK